MATRIDIELTSTQDDGQSFTWRAAGAKQPKGVAPADLFPEGSSVGDEFKVEAEMNLDGIEITQVIPPKEKKGKSIQTLELIGGDDEPLVTQQLAPKGRGDRGDRRGGRRRDRDGDRDGKGRGRKRNDGEGRGRGDRNDRGDRGDRPRTPAKPKLPPKPKPPRLRAGKTHRNAMLAELPEEHKAVANQLLSGGLQAVRSGLAEQNEQRKAKGEGPIDDAPIMDLAETLLHQVRAAEWRDRAEAALEQATTVDLRDLRSVVTAADGAAKDDETRAIAAQLRQALADRLEADHQAWIAEVIEMLDDERVVRALHLSSRPPKAGAPLPAPVALRLVEAANAAMSADTSPDRWGYVLDALAHSPVRRQVVPVSLPANVTPELKTAIARHGNRLPEIAEIFGITPDPKAGGRPGGKRRRGGKPGGKKDGGKPRAGEDAKKDAAPKGDEAEGDGATEAAPAADSTTAPAESAAASAPASAAEAPAAPAPAADGDAPAATAESPDAPEAQPAAAPEAAPADEASAG